GVGGLLLLGLLAFQVPRVMKQMHHGGAAQAAVPKNVSTPTGTTTPTLAAPTTQQDQQTPIGSSGSSATGDSSSGLITNSTGSATQGQLASFSRFESKDPFSQQVQEASPSTGSGSTSGSGTTSGPGTSSGTGSTSGSGST